MDRAGFADDEIVTLLATGDERGLIALYDRYAPVVYSLIVTIVRRQDVAEELTQEVFLRAWRQASSFESDRGRVQSWLLAISHDVAIAEVRRGDRRPRHDTDGTDQSRSILEVSDRSRMREERVPGGMRTDAVLAMLAELSQDQRRILEMAYFEGLTQAEMAERTRLPLDTIKTMTHLALQRLHSGLRAQGAEADAL
jgi:RNA polymerase sigma-70 factor (ECF subfamily)